MAQLSEGIWGAVAIVRLSFYSTHSLGGNNTLSTILTLVARLGTYAETSCGAGIGRFRSGRSRIILQDLVASLSPGVGGTIAKVFLLDGHDGTFTTVLAKVIFLGTNDFVPLVVVLSLVKVAQRA